MKKPLHAAMLSAFMCPGSGQVWLGHKLIGWVFIAISLVNIAVVMNHAINQANIIAQQILNGEVGADFASIYAQVTQIPTGEYASLYTIITWVFLVNWGVSIVHAYWLGTRPAPKKRTSI